MLESGFESLILFFGENSLLAYVALFFAMVIEGETFLIVAGVLSHLGALSLPLVLIIAYVGVMLGDLLWYGVGVLLRHHRGPLFVRNLVERGESLVRRIFPQFMERPGTTLLIAKFVYGTNHATLILAGVMRLPLSLFIRIQLLISLVWVGVFAAVGYLFGYVAIQMTRQVSVFLLIILLLIVGLIALQRFLSVYYEHRKEKR